MSGEAGVGKDLARASEVIASRAVGLGHPLSLLATTRSTNDEAKRAAKQGAPHGATWVAEVQTAGRGRYGRVWLSSPGESLLFSVLLRSPLAATRVPQLALVAGLAVRDAVARALPGGDVKIKWPNDVLIGTRKVAGVLVEATTAGDRVDAVVVGIGINVHARTFRDFPDDIAGRVTSVALAADGFHSPPPDRAAILADTLASLDGNLETFLARGLAPLRARFEADDALRGLRVRGDDAVEGQAVGVDDEGRLLVARDDGVVVRWLAGEVRLAREPP
jgi:BirA family transcriptional regulator, biotin operon repressor / biotin---[acetyl-CoA-carboxylase] ligase